MSQLTLEKNKVYTNKQLSQWFGVSSQTFRRHKNKYLNLLQDFALFEVTEKNKIKIIEVYQEVYSKETVNVKEEIRRNFLKYWGCKDSKNNNNMICSCDLAATHYYRQHPECKLKRSTLIKYFNTVKIELFGKNSTQRKPQEKGKTGKAKYIFCKRLKNDEYQAFTPEEWRMQKQYYENAGYWKSEYIDFVEDSLILEQHKRGEISDKEFDEYFVDKKRWAWICFVSEIQEKLDCVCVFATHLTIDENGNKIEVNEPIREILAVDIFK